MTQTSDILTDLRATFARHTTRPEAWRRAQLHRLKAMIEENEGAILDALHADLGKSAFEGRLTETGTVLAEINHALKHLKGWMRPTSVWTPITNQPGRSMIKPEPLGVVLVIAPWNYPFNLLATPLIGAIAAGNCAVLKPSEISAHTSRVIARLIPDYLDPQAFRVVEGAAETAKELLDERFDHIFFTGGETVGRIVMTAAAKNLTPVTLELGGKSPAIVEADCDLGIAARRLAWGKFLNAGQTCIAPDYVLVEEKAADGLVAGLRTAITEFFGADPKLSPDYPRLVSDRHFARVRDLISGGTVAVGGESDAATRYIAPTVMTGVDLEAPVMREEIFGPVLPIVTYRTIEEAIAFVTARPKPLALYLFSNTKEVRDRVLEETSSGGVCINDVVMHLAVPDLPFGGVGISGMGAYHGRASFDTFSHRKSVLVKSEWFDLPLRYAPFTATKMKWLRRLM
ncbi:MAG: aldehyde dehydrogenase family protein [Hoeflea sp.]|uniref:aldehyde dehydrogenase family protein n=1 Tax=Hoeflea sp. TaxID=1940281 RepID=UPI002731C795|nr:aldehyde dehydrogenase family protein [Hoeflea sp.]MDP2122244.1 aldehyde dehydrogenase family protein [Hoeflea sp.]